jgi:PIN domain nuclease of toxin-antitoxin system
MNVLLDTCALLWLTNNDKALPRRARTALQEATIAYVSAVTAWELGLKTSKGKIALPEVLEAWLPRVLLRHGLTELPLGHKAAIRSTALPPLHLDPADRMLAATALEHDLTLLTPDPLIRQYPGVKTLW